MKNILTLMFLPLVITGCASTYNMEVLKSPAGKLDPSYPVAVITPRDGRYSGESHFGSGKMTAEALQSGFLQHSSNVKIYPEKNRKSDFSSLKNIYLVEPQILHWEERATEWSGKPDRIKVRVDLYDTTSMSHLSSVIFSGKSKWATFGGDHPQDLLPKPIEDYVNSLY